MGAQHSQTLLFSAWVVASVGLVGCPTPSGAPVTAAVPEPAWVLFVEPERVVMDAPRRFQGRMPTSDDDLDQPELFPPFWTTYYALRDGDRQAQARLVEALAQADAAGTLSRRLSIWYEALVMRPDTAGLCGWLAEILTTPRAPVVHDFAGKHIDKCGAAVSDAMAHPAMPDDPYFDWYVEMSFYGPPRDPARLERAVAHVATTTTDLLRLWRVGRILSRVSGAHGVAMASRIAAAIGDPERRALALVEMLSHDTEEGKRFGLDACATDLPAVARFCRTSREGPARSVRDMAFLERCIEGALKVGVAAPDASTCLAELAHVDRRRAVELASEIQKHRARVRGGASPWSDYRDAIVETILRFPGDSALEAQLDAIGLTARPTDRRLDFDDSPPRARTVSELIRERGRAFLTDLGTQRFPPGHDEILLSIARVARPALDGVLFAELGSAPGAPYDFPPIFDPPSLPRVEAQVESDATWQVMAWMDGHMYRVRTRAVVSPFPDLTTVVGFANALLKARGSAVRVVHISEGEVIVAPLPALQALDEHGLADFGSVSY